MKDTDLVKIEFQYAGSTQWRPSHLRHGESMSKADALAVIAGYVNQQAAPDMYEKQVGIYRLVPDCLTERVYLRTTPRITATT